MQVFRCCAPKFMILGARNKVSMKKKKRKENTNARRELLALYLAAALARAQLIAILPGGGDKPGI